MATLSDGREVPDHYTDIADGPPTKTKLSLRTRALGIALGAAETIVPAAGSPKETLRQMAKAAKDYIVNGVERGFMRTAYDQGHAIGERAVNDPHVEGGDPHAQGAALAIGAGAAFAGARILNAKMPVLTRGPVDLTPSLKPPPEPLDVPAFQRRNVPVAVAPTEQAVRLAQLARAKQARLADAGFVGTGPESMTPNDVAQTNIVGDIGTPEALVRAAIKKAGGSPSLPDEFSQPQYSGERARLQQLWDAGRTGTVRSLIKKYRSGELEIPRNVSR